MAFSNHINLMYHPENIIKNSNDENTEPNMLINFQKKFLDENNLFLLNAKKASINSKNKKTLNDYKKMEFLICLHDILDLKMRNDILDILREI